MTHFPRLIPHQSSRVTALLCICTLAIYGCSGSSDSGPNQIEAGSESIENTVEVDNGTSNGGSGMTDMESVSGRPVDNTDSESDGSTIDNTQSSTPLASDPFSPGRRWQCPRGW